MSKNLTRKGLALGAIVALGSTLFAGTPANAAAALNIAPAAGSTWNVLSKDDFIVKATGNIDLADAQLAKLAFEVTNSASVTVAYDAVKNANSAAITGETVDGTSTTAGSGTTDVVKASWSVTAGDFNALSIDPTTTALAPDATFVVRAFIDVDLSGTVTDGDVVSASQTIKFISGASVTATTVLDEPAGGSKPVATTTLNNDINLAQTDLANFGVYFSTNASSLTAKGSSVDALNDAKTAIVSTADTNATAGATIGAQPFLNKSDADSSLTAEGTAVYRSALAAGDATGAAVTFDNSATIRSASSTDANSASSSASSAVVGTKKVVRSGTKTVSFTVQFKKYSATATDNKVNVASGQPVKVTLAETGNTSFATGEEITAGGKTLKDSTDTSAQVATYYTTTGTDGKVTVTLAAKLGDAGTGLNVQVASGASFGVITETFLSWKAAAADRLVETTARLGHDDRRITKGGAVSVAYSVLDDFGQPFAAADTSYQVVVTSGGGSGSDENINQTVSLSGGKGSATITDNSTQTGNYVLTGALQSRTTGAWAPLSVANTWTTAPAGNGSVATNVTVVSALDVAATAAITAPVLTNSAGAIDTTNGAPLADKALAAGDSRFDLNTASTVPAFGSGKGVVIAGKITTATGANAVAVPVVISAAGVGFVDASGKVSTIGSITVYTDASGDYSVSGYSKTSGAVVFTVTSGAAVKTQSVTFAKAAEIDAASVTVTAVKTTKTGRAIDVTVTVLDISGNGIDTDAAAAGGITDTLDITVTGAGYTYSVPTSTNSKGQASFKLVYLSDDAGITNITASFDADGAGSTYAAKTGTAQVLAGVTASVSAGKKLATSVVKNASGATIKVVSGSKSVTKVATSDSYKVTLSKLTSGSKTVKVYVNDVLVTSKKVTVKK